MANLKEIRTRIVSVNSTMQITSAMKMVSAAKLKRAQDAITRMRPYAEKLKDILENASASVGVEGSIFSQQREAKTVWVIVITSNRGLCGGFNNNVIKRVTQLVNEEYKDANPRVLCLGKKIRDSYKRSDAYFINDALEPVEDIFNALNFENTTVIANELMRMFTAKEFDKVVVVYNRFVNAATQDVRTEQYLPIVPTVQEDSSSAGDYIFEPTKAEIVADLIPKSLKIQLFKGLLDSNAA